MLDGRCAVITGASSGIGRATAVALAEAGAHIVAHYHTAAAAAEDLQRQLEQQGHRCRLVSADFSRLDELESFVERAWDCWGRVDLWVQNAGADVLTGAAAQWSFQDKLARLWEVDVRATLEICRLVGQRFQQAEPLAGGSHRSIVTVGWDQAQQGMEGDSGQMFAAVKGAVMAFTRSLAQTLAPQVRVNCVAPGWIQTDWGQSTSDYWDQRARRQALLKRWGSPDDVARVIRFLVSDESAFVTGQVIPVNGGFCYYPE